MLERRNNFFSNFYDRYQEIFSSENIVFLLTFMFVAMGIFLFSWEIISGALIAIFLLWLGRKLIKHLCKQEDSPFLSLLFTVGFLSRVWLALMLSIIYFAHEGRWLVGDGWCYSENGHIIEQLFRSGLRDINLIRNMMGRLSVSGNLTNYDFWNALVYCFTGKSPLSVVFINCFCGAFSAVFIYYIAKQLSNRRSAVIASFLMTFWPSVFFWSVQNLKEAPTIFLLYMLIWCFFRMMLINKIKISLLFLIILGATILKMLNIYADFIFFAAILFYLTFIFMQKFKIKNIFILLFFLISAMFTIFFNDVIVNYLAIFISSGNKQLAHSFQLQDSLINWLFVMRNYRACGSTAFLSGFDFRTPFGFFIFTPLSLLITLLAPFPWQVASKLQIMAIPEMLLYYLLLIMAFKGIKLIYKYKRKEAILMSFFIITSFLVFSFFEGNIGTVFRHRSIILPIFFILASVSIEKKIKIR